ncbi:MAG TPA: hypothetical protein VGK67_15360 [Myxococcales bacterium]|jgi:hypothetical protein
MLRVFLPMLLAAAALVAPIPALADHYFVFPQVGFGYGRVTENGFADYLGKFDLMLGQEYDTGGPRGAVGWLLDVAYATNFPDQDASNPPPRYWRIEVAPMVTVSSGYNWWTLFARLGIGPHFEYASRAGEVVAGGGLQIEGALGSKNAIELFTQGFASVDGHGLNFSVIGGLRLNAIAFMALVDLMQGRSPRLPDPSPGYHHAVPAR